MDVQEWIEQLSTSPSVATSSSPPTSPLPRSGDFERKRIMTSPLREPSPSKRRRTDGRASLSDLSDRTRLQSTTSTPSRPGSPTRSIFIDLRRADPPIICEPQATGDLPRRVVLLRKRLTENFGGNILPRCFESRIEGLDREYYQDIPDYAYTTVQPPDAEALWQRLGRIYSNARDCDTYGKDENAWCLDVVQPLLNSVLEGTMLHLVSVQSQQIDKNLLPTAANSLAKLNKKADYSFEFSGRTDAFDLYQKVSFGGLGMNISQTTDAYTKLVALFSGLEVKPDDGGKKEALAQLTIWLTAGIRKTTQLYQITKAGCAEGHVPPTLGFTVIGHDWHTYMAYDVGKEMHVIGPISTIYADTRSIYGIFKIRDLLYRAIQYAEEEYWPWMRDEVLRPLAGDNRSNAT